MQYGKKLGEGSYGKVYESFCKKFAIKVIECCLCKSVYKELYFSKHLNHENILQAKKIKILKTSTNYIVELYFPKKTINLQKYLLLCENIKHETKIKFMYQILNAIDYLHSLNICHKDIKLDNFLVDEEDLSLYLIDFGSTSYSISPIKDRVCALWLQAPEILNFKKGEYYNIKKVDSWCVGCILFALFCYKYPYSGKNRKDLRNSIEKVNLDIELISLEFEIKNIIKGLLEKNFEKRLYCEEAKQIFYKFLEKNYEKNYKNFINFNFEEENFEENENEICVDDEIIYLPLKKKINNFFEKIPKNILRFLINLLLNFLHIGKYEYEKIIKIFGDIRQKNIRLFDDLGNYELACLSLALDLGDYSISIEEIRNLSLFFFKFVTIKKIENLKIEILQC
jgi:serine/threonine protein kinase